MRKLIIPFILFISFFNGIFDNSYSNTKLYDSNEVTIEIDSARLDKDDLQVSWSIGGIENIDQVILSVSEITSDGLLGDPAEFVDNSSEAIKIIPWDGTTNLSLTLKILTTTYTQYSGPECESIYCYKDITTEITSDLSLIHI